MTYEEIGGLVSVVTGALIGAGVGVKTASTNSVGKVATNAVIGGVAGGLTAYATYGLCRAGVDSGIGVPVIAGGVLIAAVGAGKLASYYTDTPPEVV